LSTKRTTAVIAFVFLSMAVVAGSPAADTDPETPPWAAPPIERAVTVLDGRTGAVVTFESMLDTLAGADAVFLGESHVDETTHRVELAVYEGLLERRDGAVVLALEMFDRDVQVVLDSYLAGKIDEAEFLEQSRPWGQYRSAYRPMVERARENKRPVIASNFPRPLVRRVAMEGLSVIDTLEGDERSHAPAELYPNTPEYWRRVDNAVRGHLGMMSRSEGDDQRLASTQTLWDNSMGESCSLALDAHPGSMVLHVNGGFHSMYWDGTVRQFLLRKPDASVITVDIRSTRNPSVMQIEGAPVADFVVMAEARATDRNEGMLTVAFDRTLDYRFHLPEGATDGQPVPLLIWLGDDGLSSQDGMDLWRERLGDDAAIVVIEPPYRARFDDLSEGGRWFWPDSFAGDIFSVVHATERIWAYLLRYYPIDPNRISVAGEGTGATLAAAISLRSDRMAHRAMAFEPRRYAKLKDFPLPLPEDGIEHGHASSLTVLGSPGDESWWREELAAYREIGIAGSFVVRDSNAFGRDERQASALRDALGLPAASPNAASPLTTTPAVARMIVSVDTPRARHWSRLYALRHTAKTGQPVALMRPDDATDDSRDRDNPASEINPAIHPSTVSEIIPRCPGPFGGTTVLVLPEGISAADAQAWIALEDADPLAKASRFHRVRIAMLGEITEDRSLQNVLSTLASEGRKNVLVVPAVFCADTAMMHMLERQTRKVADTMTIQWLPGLGGEKLPVFSTTSEPD